MESVCHRPLCITRIMHEGKPYDTLVVCVCRTSGWMVATPHLNKGLTADKVAKSMYRHWEMFGIPSIVTSDRGQHFASAWWMTMCALHGVYPRYGQAYHHQANGRAENAGQQILRKLSKFVADRMVKEASWVELLPTVLRVIHDTPGESGLSPYEIVFGRHRPLASLPYRPLRQAEDAVEFFERVEEMRKKVADKMKTLQKKERPP